jgi:DeoR/GlpR family transcriptional regulator of sugar metabolism
MKKKEAKITIDEWLKEAFPPLENTRPDGSFTIVELVEKTGISDRTWRSRLNSMVAKGELIKTKFLDGGKVSNYFTPIKK